LREIDLRHSYDHHPYDMVEPLRLKAQPHQTADSLPKLHAAMANPSFLDRRSPVFAGRAMASSSSPLVTRVGLRVLEQGGNAADAAVAMAGMLALAEPMT
jgi:gamma-glutamyltranspeptidase